MSSYKNRNQIRQRSRDQLDRRMDKWIETGKQVVDGVAGNRPGQNRGRWQDKTTAPNFKKVGRWMEEKIDWFFEDDDEWLNNEDLEDDLSNESIINTKRPLGAISLRAPKALPPHIDQKRNNQYEIDEWPDDQSFRLNKWQRKDNVLNQDEQDANQSFQSERSSRRRNIPRSSRRKY
ncbi:RNA helicase [Prochlorococcus marinus]|uniref:RNA helicase n=1 Tax=Prochlorococcus marinus XMU1408 TaxID=2213228 RepID=A0A318RBH4_PROMR|nr:RNA helicase [Prochlorococcus marinus]MBW3042927.1 RNA helicase [Prochlorococcus marinus str. XMU1408]PYE00282.1 RNA helicase [Prochlorococcus marinus XMU1408]